MSSTPPGPNAPLGSFGDKLTIDTPEQTALDFPIAGVGSRFLALAYDAILQILVGIIVGILGAVLIGFLSTPFPNLALWTGALLILFYFLLYFGYYIFFEIWWRGQTPGKRKAGIRVIKDSGRPLTAAESVARNLMRIVDWLPALYAVGIASALLTRENKRLGDLVAGSLVVREVSLGDMTGVLQTTPVDPTAAAMGADKLSAEELNLIESYLSRRKDLDPSVRFRMADEIFRRLRPKLTLPDGFGMSSDKALEQLFHERRTSGGYS